MGKIREQNLKYLEWVARNTRTSPHIKQMMNEYIDLYRYSKIAQKDTVINAIISLSSANKKIQEKAIKQYETDIEDKRSKAPLNERMRISRINKLGTKIDNNYLR